jgi:hypothetical protein
MFPWQWIQQEIFKAVSIDGFIYCLPCAKKVADEMQHAELSDRLKKTYGERKAYYAEIARKIEFHELREKAKEALADEEVNYDDAAKMTKLLKPRDGSMQTKTIRESLIENIKKSDLHNSEKKIILGGSDVPGK